nr:tetratricopeptide repeat-containing sensor histidine kinase [Rhodoferax sp.]
MRPLDLEFFAADGAVALLEAAVTTATQEQRPAALVALAWQLRQRDTQRALTLADAADTCLAEAGIPTTNHHHAARLQLIRAEAKWLFGELDAAKTLAQDVLQDLASEPQGSADDALLRRADAHWLLAMVAAGQGNLAQAHTDLEATIVAATPLDAVRVTIAQAATTGFLAFRDVAAAKTRGLACFTTDSTELHPAAAAAVEDFWGLVAGQSGDYLQGVRHFSKSYPLSLATGQKRRALVTGTNIGGNLNSLNDYKASFEWMQRAQDLARPTGWPGLIALAQLQTAETLRLLERFDAAADLLREALAMLASQPGSRYYAMALQYLADVELDRKHWASALDIFRQLEQRGIAVGQADLMTEASRGQARALLELGQPEPALQAAHAALASASADAYRRIAALRVLADIHARHALAAPSDMLAASATLHYLQQALEAAATIEDYTVPSDLLEVLAQAYADGGDTAKAFDLTKQAISARERTHSQEASNRAVAMQVTYETQRARAEEQHQRQLAEAHAERANLLEQANEAYHAVLENAQDAIVLTDSHGRIHNWNRQAVLSFGWTREEALDRDIIGMLFPTRFRGEVGTTITTQLAMQQNTPRLEIMAMRRDGTEFPIELSVTFSTVRSQFECSFFIRDITQRVKAALEIAESMARQQELADLKSRFVAIASHEFRTPLATILSSSDLLKLYGERMDAQERDGCFAFISEAVHRMKNMLEDVLLIGTTDAGVSQFKPCAHALGPLCESIVEEVRHGFADKSATVHPIEFRIADPLCLADLDERWFRHIFGNLLSNAVKYSPDGGVVCFDAIVQGHAVEFQVADRGIGLPEQDIPRLFESFFRASNSGKISGTGLGLSIVKRAVELHGGRIAVASELGKGTTFTVVLPLRQDAGPMRMTAAASHLQPVGPEALL